MTYTRPSLLRHALGRLDRAGYRIGLRSARRLTLPEFLCIGAQKAGTTWLWENLRRHPELYLPDEKEIHYFDWHYDEPLRSYAHRFAPGRDKVKGEVTPGYSIIHPRRIGYIRRIMPDVRSILIIRNPIDRAWSHAYKNLVDLPGRRLDDVPTQAFLDHFGSPGSVARGDYITIVDRWTGVFPADQLLVVFFDHLRERPRELLSSVFTFLGVTTDVDWSDFPHDRIVLPRYQDDRVLTGDTADAPVTSAKDMPAECRAFLEDMYRTDLDALARRFDGPATNWLPAKS